MSALAHLIKDNGVNTCIIEDNFGDGMFTKLFSPVVRRIAKHCAILEEKVHSNKEKRIIDALEPLMNQHRLIINREAIRREVEWVQKDRQNNLQYSLIYQMTRITKTKGSLKHDDRLDALAGCIKFFLDFLNKDVELAVKSAKERAMLDEFNRLRALHKMLYPDIKAKNETSASKMLKRGGIRGSTSGNRNSTIRRR